MNWYAIRVFYNHIFRIKEELEAKGVKTYMALKTAKTATRTRTVQLAFKQDHFSELMVYKRADSNEPAPIDPRQMEMFILVTSALDGREVEIIQPFDFKPGERVRVTEGPFKGAQGVIRRIKKDRKLLVEVSGVVVVAVSHIPGQFLERISPDTKDPDQICP